MRITGREFVHLAGLNLLRAELRWLAGVQPYVLLQHQRVREFLVANGTLMQHPERRLRPVHAHVSLQVTLRGERPAADLALERSLARVGPVMHLQRAFAGQDSVANHALVRVGQFVLDVVHQLLQLGRFRGLGDLDQTFPRVVVAARPWQQAGIDGWILGRIDHLVRIDGGRVYRGRGRVMRYLVMRGRPWEQNPREGCLKATAARATARGGCPGIRDNVLRQTINRPPTGQIFGLLLDLLVDLHVRVTF